MSAVCIVCADTMVWLVWLLAGVVVGEEIISGVEKDDLVTEKANDNVTYEALPTAQEWRNAPSCPLWGPMDSFYKEGIEKGRYLGRWWLQDKHSELADLTGKCWSQTYSVDYINMTIIRDTGYQTSIGSFPRIASGEVTIADIKDANLLTFTPEESFLSSPPVEYRVLATDYETFSIEYSCKDTKIIRRNEVIWIYTREKKAPRSVLKRAYKSLKVLGLSGWKLKKIDQSCKEAKKVMPARRTFKVPDVTTTLKPPFLKLGTPPITTSQLTARMLGSGLKLAQKVFVPWTLHPHLGKGMGVERKQKRRTNVGMGNMRRRSGSGGRGKGRNSLRRKSVLSRFGSKAKRHRNYDYY